MRLLEVLMQVSEDADNGALTSQDGISDKNKGKTCDVHGRCFFICSLHSYLTLFTHLATLAPGLMPCKPLLLAPDNLIIAVLHVTHACAAAKGIHNDSRSQAAQLPETCGQAVYLTQKQASGDGLYRPADNQDAAVGKGASQALSPIAAGKLPVAR